MPRTGLRADFLLQRHAPVFLAEIGILAGIVFTGPLSVALLAFPNIQQKRIVAYAPRLMISVFADMILLACQTYPPPAPRSARTVECLLCIISYTLLPSAWMFHAQRRYASTHYYLAGSITLLTAFSLGTLSLRLSEQPDSLVHIVQWHYLPMIGAASIGLWLGKVLLKW